MGKRSMVFKNDIEEPEGLPKSILYNISKCDLVQEKHRNLPTFKVFFNKLFIGWVRGSASGAQFKKRNGDCYFMATPERNDEKAFTRAIHELILS